jgi:hypothetical protein
VIVNDDEDNDSDDLVIISEKVSKNIKAKTIEAKHQFVVCIGCYLPFLALD